MKFKSYVYCPYCSLELQEKLVEMKIRKHCDKCGFIHFINPVPVVVIAAPRDNGILLIKRGIEPARHQWALPGGFVDENEHPLHAAGRELNEETGLISDDLELIGLYTRFSELKGSILVIAYHARTFSGIPKAGDDAEDAVFFPLDKLPNIAFDTHIKVIEDCLKLRLNR